MDALVGPLCSYKTTHPCLFHLGGIIVENLSPMVPCSLGLEVIMTKLSRVQWILH